VADLAKELKISRQTFYSWIEAYKKRAMASIDRVGKSKSELEKIDKATLNSSERDATDREQEAKGPACKSD
jgi:hypothetical protein